MYHEFESKRERCLEMMLIHNWRWNSQKIKNLKIIVFFLILWEFPISCWLYSFASPIPLPWVHMYNFPVVPIKHYFLVEIHHVWLLQYFWSSPVKISELFREGCDMSDAFRAKHSASSFILLADHLRDSLICQSISTSLMGLFFLRQVLPILALNSWESLNYLSPHKCCMYRMT